VSTILTDPLAVTFDGNSTTLPRIAAGKGGTIYRAADSILELTFQSSRSEGNGKVRRDIVLSRQLPDPTPGNSFDDFRVIRNSFGVSFTFDPITRAGVSVDIPLLRTALLAFLTPAYTDRIIAGEG
jgi:hypothetical protein